VNYERYPPTLAPLRVIDRQLAFSPLFRLDLTYYLVKLGGTTMSRNDLKDVLKDWSVKAKERFLDFFENRALVTRGQISLARMKHAEDEKARNQKAQNLKR
jgi:hypothetical protein